MFSQGAHQRSYFPSFNEQRPPSAQHRPQTPGGYSSNYAQPSLNRSYHKLPIQGNSYPVPQKNNFSRSRVSMASSQASHLSQLASEPDIFPEELVFLLRNEEKNINNVKEKVEKEKARV
jgi:hypothetical protein